MKIYSTENMAIEILHLSFMFLSSCEQNVDNLFSKDGYEISSLRR